MHTNLSLLPTKQFFVARGPKKNINTNKLSKFAHCCDFMSQFFALYSFNLIIIYWLALESFQHGCKIVDMTLENITINVKKIYKKTNLNVLEMDCFPQKCVKRRINLFSSWRHFHSVTHLKRVSFASLFEFLGQYTRMQLKICLH